MSERIVRELLDLAGITINGSKPWDIRVHDQRFYKRLLSDKLLGLGESYMEGWWDCEQLDECITKIARAGLEYRVKGNWKLLLHGLRSKIFNLQRFSRAYQVGEKHYDLGNDLYSAMLDTRLNYTCAYWKNAKTLDQAQEAKLELVCKKIGIRSGMKILDLGCGWGSFAKYAAEKYNANVVGVTVSKEQVELGKKLCSGLNVELRIQDYREVRGEFDAVISIGIMEHVGYKNYPTYMQVVDRTLKPNGIAFIHTIGRNNTSTSANPWIDKYIFPNGMLPSLAQLTRSMENLFILEDLHNIGPHYDKTLMAWYHNFENAWTELQNRYSERFFRMWRFYLMCSAGGFRSRDTQLWQMVMTRTGSEQPECRFC
jgi:cyclopropane-fatty-acyl-phospholipid synthase